MKLEIENFGGIKKLTDLFTDKRNILLFGANGTGKSSIIDAFKYLKDELNNEKALRIGNEQTIYSNDEIKENR